MEFPFSVRLTPIFVGAKVVHTPEPSQPLNMQKWRQCSKILNRAGVTSASKNMFGCMFHDLIFMQNCRSDFLHRISWGKMAAKDQVRIRVGFPIQTYIRAILLFFDGLIPFYTILLFFVLHSSFKKPFPLSLREKRYNLCVEIVCTHQFKHYLLSPQGKRIVDGGIVPHGRRHCWHWSRHSLWK